MEFKRNWKQNSSTEIENKIQMELVIKLKKSSNGIENKIENTKLKQMHVAHARLDRGGISGFGPLKQPALKIGLLL
jgi:hypothetical protein